jgi:DNA processing protein
MASLKRNLLISDAIDATTEAGAFEALWAETGATHQSIFRRLQSSSRSKLSDFVERDIAGSLSLSVRTRLLRTVGRDFYIKVFGELDYPAKLRDSIFPPQLLYLRGNLDLLAAPTALIVGNAERQCGASDATGLYGLELRQEGFELIVNMADLNWAHPRAMPDLYSHSNIGLKTNALAQAATAGAFDLDKRIAQTGLLLSAAPNLDAGNKNFLSDAEETEKAMMSTAVSMADIVLIEDFSNKMGTLYYVQESIRQGRQLFVTDSCCRSENFFWSYQLERAGAVLVQKFDDIRRKLALPTTGGWRS